MPIYSPYPINSTLDTGLASLACYVPKLRTSKYLSKMAAWPWQIRPRSRSQSTRRSRFTHTRLVWTFVLWNDFSLKFCALKWFQSEILCSEMISVRNFVLWKDFSLKFSLTFCGLKWFQSEILCSEMISVWNFVLWNFVLWTEIFLSLSAIVKTHLIFNTCQYLQSVNLNFNSKGFTILPTLKLCHTRL